MLKVSPKVLILCLSSRNTQSGLIMTFRLRIFFLHRAKGRKGWASILTVSKSSSSIMPTVVWILCLKFSLNPLGFSITRETGTKMTRAKSWAIVNNLTSYTKSFGQFHHSNIEILEIAQLLAIFIFVSVSLVRENLSGLRENLKHKIRTCYWSDEFWT